MTENGRVTQKQLYETLTGMEQRLMTQIGKNHYLLTTLRVEISSLTAQAAEHQDEIARLRTRSNLLDGANAILVVIGAGLSSLWRGD